MPILTLLTDFGLDDYYVAAVKGVVLAGAPETVLVDVSHGVAAGDVEGAAFLLAAAAPVFPDGTVHLAVVDPGVGSGRRILALDDGRHRFLAPDNGLLTPWLDRPGVEVYAAERPDLDRPSPGATFHGRDRFAPLAAALLGGEPCTALGAPVSDPIRLELPPPRREPSALRGRVVRIDRFGNVVTDLPAAWLDGERAGPAAAPSEVEVEIGNRWRRTRRVACYAELETGQAGILTGSLDTLELSLPGDDLAAAWGVRRGDRVRIRPGHGLSLGTEG